MFDQSKNQKKEKCNKCKKIHPDVGLYEVWRTKLTKAKIIKCKYCAKCFEDEKEEFFKS
jgi:hypothetical protein